MAGEDEAVFCYQSVVRGHHVYKAIWTPKLGEILKVFPEPSNDHDRRALTQFPLPPASAPAYSFVVFVFLRAVIRLWYTEQLPSLSSELLHTFCSVISPLLHTACIQRLL